MHIQAVTFFVVAFILVNLTSGTFDWQTTDDGNHDVKIAGYPNLFYPSVLDEPIISEEAAELDNRIPLQRLALRLLEANRESVAFRRDTRQQHYSPRKPTCHGNTCNQRGWKRSLVTTDGEGEEFRRDTRQHYSPRKPTCHGNTCNQRGWKRSLVTTDGTDGENFRRDTRQQHYSPRKPTCQGNTCNERGWKRSWATR